MGVKGTCKIANSPGAAVFPQLDAVCFARGMFLDPVTRRQSDSGRASEAGAIARVFTLGHVTLLTSSVCPGARARYSHRDVPVPFAAAEEHLRLLVGHGREN